jgi:hypothetical protein
LPVLPHAAAKSNRLVVQIKNVTHFSYGAYQNGDVDIWAAGEAGWYRIKPADSFVDTFQSMIEAVNIVYFTADCYKTGKLSAEELFSRYAQIHHITLLEAKEKFYSHARFLASRMKKGEEGVKWGHTGFYQHLRKSHPEAFGVVSTSSISAPANTLAPVSAPIRTVTTRIQKESAPSRSQSGDERPLPRSRRLRGAETAIAVESVPKSKTTTRQKEASLPSKVNKANAIIVWKFLQKVVNNNQPEPTAMSIEAFAHYLYQSFTFEDEEEAATYLLYLAVELVSMMQQKRRRSYEWPELPVYDELLEAELTPAQRRKMAGVVLERRTHPLSADDDDDEEISSVDSDSAEEEVMNEDEMAHHRKSGLRPKSGSKFSGKGAGRKGKGKGPQNRLAKDADEDNEAMDVDASSKRKSSSEDDQDTPPKKRFTRSQGDQDPELEDLEFAWQQAKSIGIPFRRKAKDRPLVDDDDEEGEEIRLAVVATPIISTEPNDPGDVWTCTHQGCLHKVYGASEDDGKELILEHLDEHTRNQAIDLILSERGRTHLPVRYVTPSLPHDGVSLTRSPYSNLIKRIREMTEAQNGPTLGTAIDSDSGTSVTTLFPQRIMRRV